ncbi:PTS sugar transporter subunit IIA [Lacticaseibacillus casei]|uniref:Ascorbate-specific PTS system EIIA component n=2 Tax=Lacticaseibacillus TaxID=2759736 RepID=A0ABY9L602_9LACO|nr:MULTISPECIES: PTS sugar transporter subunit IIA [Lacticaseibacillus]MDE3283739.1 PTS sugar transporter subunit IIA [Lacticaseibacillus casei]MDG3062804.1 PTS sugar transporter subunit IIA [Lacticaseibacillus sp. BCRC 81376]QVI36656.1 PTS sugar transporter subunit IIA [Lacticaseibacillus casei]QXG58447.1 PTS sugar transporter subunit IIA [Lacticaseibacillus casei]WFB40083.1 PTS sugar transporter subunit IIA [Lacticaseibacillus huelsenbergensis]
MLLKDFWEKDLVDIRPEPATDWRDALRQAANKLIEHQYILPGYVNEIIGNVEKNGPYIVIVPGVAMPHAMAESTNVLGTAIGFAKFPEPVIFDPDDPEKQAQLFFTLAAKEPNQHLQNIGDLSDMLMTEGLIDRLLAVESVDDFKVIVDAES